jgi:hypothetical protein
MILYHGSNSLFNKFDQGKARIVNDFYGGGVAYFTSSKDVAKTYANAMVKAKGGTKYIYEVEVNISKIFDVNDTFTGKELTKFFTDKEAEDFARGAGLMKAGTDRYDVLSKIKSGEYKLTGDEVFKGMSKGMTFTARARLKLIALGYDGLRYNGGLNMQAATKHDVYLVYNASDIHIKKIVKVNDTISSSGKIITESMQVVDIKIPPPGLTFSREQMPQLGPLGDVLKNFRKHNIEFHKELIDPKKLKSSQAEFNKSKVVDIMMNRNKNTLSGVIISNDNYVLDGHHRWLAHYNENRKIEVIRVDMPILELMRLVKTFNNTHYKDINTFSESIKSVVRESLQKSIYRL